MSLPYRLLLALVFILCMNAPAAIARPRHRPSSPQPGCCGKWRYHLIAVPRLRIFGHRSPSRDRLNRGASSPTEGKGAATPEVHFWLGVPQQAEGNCVTAVTPLTALVVASGRTT